MHVQTLENGGMKEGQQQMTVTARGYRNAISGPNRIRPFLFPFSFFPAVRHIRGRTYTQGISSNGETNLLP